MVFSPDGQILAVSSETDEVRVWHLGTEKELFRLAGATNVKALVFSPDGRTLATAANEPIIRFWDAKSGQEKTSFRGDIGKVAFLAYSPDGTTLASWSERDSRYARIHLWDMTSGTQKEPLTLGNGLTDGIVFSPDSQTLAVPRSDTAEVQFCNLATRNIQFVALKPAESVLSRAWVGDLTFCSDGRKMVFYKEVTRVTLWDIDKRQEQAVFEVANRTVYPSATLRADGKLAAVGEGAGILTLWNPETGKKRAVVHASQDHVPFAYFSPDGRTMATHEIKESAVKIWDIPTLVGKED